ncbi:hypothetical protein HAX54_020188 [Datura stramonium]|uniref:Uncharacterized protein n=1 Tax=Datura stramonium TaxID=4076 RepID=A0ABS8US61_DATST|nr:hypothetical protein [Datura stramonium]
MELSQNFDQMSERFDRVEERLGKVEERISQDLPEYPPFSWSNPSTTLIPRFYTDADFLDQQPPPTLAPSDPARVPIMTAVVSDNPGDANSRLVRKEKSQQIVVFSELQLIKQILENCHHAEAKKKFITLPEFSLNAGWSDIADTE